MESSPRGHGLEPRRRADGSLVEDSRDCSTIATYVDDVKLEAEKRRREALFKCIMMMFDSDAPHLSEKFLGMVTMEPEILDALELSVEDEIPEVADLIDTLETLEAHEAVEPEAIEAPEIIIEAPALGDSSAVNGDFERVEWEIMARINAIRADRGLSELTYDPRLQAGAVKHSAEMYRMNYFSHTSPIADHAEFDQRIQREGIKNFQSAGENLVMGPDSADLAERFVDLWMDSPGHRDNILGDDFRFSGVGVYGEGDRVYATQLFSQRVDRAFE